MFPQIDSPCPLKSLQLSGSGNTHCSHCKREVHNLNLMNEQQRQDFLLSCDDKICVSYSVKNQAKKLALAGLFVVTASGMALPAAAQTGDDVEADIYEDIIVMGGVKNAKQLASEMENQNQSSVNSLELIPVVEEEDDFASGV